MSRNSGELNNSLSARVVLTMLSLNAERAAVDEPIEGLLRMSRKRCGVATPVCNAARHATTLTLEEA